VITPEIRAEIRRLVLVEGLRIGVVARKFGVHHGTVRRALRDEAPAQAAPLSSALDAFKPYIVNRIIDLPELTSARLLLELDSRLLRFARVFAQRNVSTACFGGAGFVGRAISLRRSFGPSRPRIPSKISV